MKIISGGLNFFFLLLVATLSYTEVSESSFDMFLLLNLCVYSLVLFSLLFNVSYAFFPTIFCSNRQLVNLALYSNYFLFFAAIALICALFINPAISLIRILELPIFMPFAPLSAIIYLKKSQHFLKQGDQVSKET